AWPGCWEPHSAAQSSDAQSRFGSAPHNGLVLRPRSADSFLWPVPARRLLAVYALHQQLPVPVAARPSELLRLVCAPALHGLCAPVPDAAVLSYEPLLVFSVLPAFSALPVFSALPGAFALRAFFARPAYELALSASVLPAVSAL